MTEQGRFCSRYDSEKYGSVISLISSYIRVGLTTESRCKGRRFDDSGRLSETTLGREVYPTLVGWVCPPPIGRVCPTPGGG